MSRDHEREARILGRYLIGADPSPAVTARYAAACHRLFGGPEPPRQAAVLAFATRRPWSLPFLDAASGLLEGQSALRRRLMLMLALLETVPEHADRFLAPPRSPARAAGMIAAWGCASVLKIAAGTVLLPLARWRG